MTVDAIVALFCQSLNYFVRYESLMFVEKSLCINTCYCLCSGC